ncbi:cys-loop ligand-gated ion channel-like isoform X3 [Octopus vulgaris]|uniref:Cys-loop ligand-gated ion channel-like isoform X3 n=1 Tax=Octopus vulgaris TaxID=6645 RepID=A0AA36F9B8_OCTVU|nr:cys-loop ligand-gated ion channel-like isoform X3 [Octopus vulgaris]
MEVSCPLMRNSYLEKLFSFNTVSFNRNIRRFNEVRVQIVVQFAKVGEIDTLKEQYSADVIVKGKWREPALDGQTHTALEGIDIKKYWSPKLYIENTLGDPKENIRHRVNFNDKGEAYIVEKRVIKGTFMENLELNDFPFDVQDLTVTVASELPSYEVELIEDIDEHHVVNRQSFVDEQEWHLYMHTETEKKELAIDQADATVRRLFAQKIKETDKHSLNEDSDCVEYRRRLAPLEIKV